MTEIDAWCMHEQCVYLKLILVNVVDNASMLKLAVMVENAITINFHVTLNAHLLANTNSSIGFRSRLYGSRKYTKHKSYL